MTQEEINKVAQEYAETMAKLFPELKETTSIDRKEEILKEAINDCLKKQYVIRYMSIIIISVSLFILMFLFLGHANISFKPFSISIPYWHRAVGITLVVIGVCVYNIGERFSGYKE